MIFKQLDSGSYPDTSKLKPHTDISYESTLESESKKHRSKDKAIASNHVFDELSEEQILASRHGSVVEDIKDKAKEEGYLIGEQEGYEQGYNAGLNHGFEVGKNEAKLKFESENEEILQTLKADLAELLYHLNVCYQTWTIEAERQLCKLVAQICRQTIGAELELKQDYILAFVRQAFEQIGARGAIKIRVNPIDKATLEANQNWLSSHFSSIDGVEIINDPTIRSGCILEMDNGIVDAQIDRVLNDLEENTNGIVVTIETTDHLSKLADQEAA